MVAVITPGFIGIGVGFLKCLSQRVVKKDKIYNSYQLVMVIIRFRVQFVNNLHKWVFKKAGTRKLYDYLLIVRHEKLQKSDDLIADREVSI